jgi:ABC-type Mn2+/Zn2+ transport system ATPase subunit
MMSCIHPTSDHTPSPEKYFFVEHLSVRQATSEILKDLSFTVQQGTVLSVMGPNGGGKTTLFQTLSGIKTAVSGKWGWHENGLKKSLNSGDWTYLPQRFHGDRSFPLRVHEVLKLSHPKLSQTDIQANLAVVKLDGYYHAPIQGLSEGQFQRLLFARLCAQPTPIVFLDEPFAGLDETIIEDLLGIIQAWKNAGRIILLSHHNRLRALTHFPYTLLLARSTYHCGPSANILTPSIWQTLHESICRTECC